MKNILNTLSLKTQLNLFITLGISAIISAIIIVNFNNSQSATLNTELKTAQEVLKSESEMIDIYLKDIESFSLISWLNADFNHVVASKEPLTYQTTNIISNQASKMMQSRNDIQKVKIYLTNKNKIVQLSKNNTKTLFSTYEYEDFNNLVPLKKVQSNPKFYYIEKDETNENYFIFHRGIINIQTQEVIALISITFNDSYLNACLNNKNSSIYTKFLISNGEIFYSNTHENFELENYDGTKNTYSVNDNDYLVNDVNSENYNYEIISFKNSESVTKEIIYAKNISILLAIVLIIASSLLTAIFTSYITRPFYELSAKLKDVGQGNFKTKININGSQEIKELDNSFNTMTEQIETLINKTYVAKINENMAKLIALEAQINPHFINNALQAISTEALLNDQDKIYEMVNSIAQMLRYTIENDDIVSINAELAHINQYMLMQKYRFDTKLEYTISVDTLTDRELTKIPKLSIQTLLENCIEHGMKSISYTLEIYVNIYSENNKTFIEVMDNGCGISKESIDSLNANFADWENTFKNEKNNIGITNLYSRLKLLFNNESELRIANLHDKGTIIVIEIPLCQEVT